MTEQRLEEIEERANAATEGPWVADWKGTKHFEICAPSAEGNYWVSHPDGGMQHGPNLDFCAHARTDVPDLVAEVRRLREIIEKLGYVSRLED